MSSAILRPGLFGWVALGLGAAALLGAMLSFWAGPFAPQPSVETFIAETAVEIRTAADRALRGEPAPAPVSTAYTLDDWLRLAVAALAGAALIAAGVGYALAEQRRALVAGALLGTGAIAFQLATWALLAALSVALIWIIASNLNAILGDA